MRAVSIIVDAALNALFLRRLAKETDHKLFLIVDQHADLPPRIYAVEARCMWTGVIPFALIPCAAPVASAAQAW